jgi:hypothetical protein
VKLSMAGEINLGAILTFKIKLFQKKN